MPPALAAVPGQALQACLAFVKAPGVDAEHGVDAAQFLWQLVGGNRRLRATVERRERLAAVGKSWGAAAPTKLHLTLVEAGEEDLKQSVNGQLLAAGLARLVEPKGAQVGPRGGGAAGGLRRGAAAAGAGGPCVAQALACLPPLLLPTLVRLLSLPGCAVLFPPAGP